MTFEKKARWKETVAWAKAQRTLNLGRRHSRQRFLSGRHPQLIGPAIFSRTIADGEMIKLTDLIARVSREVKTKVQRTRDDVRSVLQDALRAECRLVMRTQEETEQRRQGAQVQAEVAVGHPLALEDIEFPADIARVLLLGRYRNPLEQASDCIPQLLKLGDHLWEQPEPDKWAPASASEMQLVESWVTQLLRVLNEHDPLKKVLMVSEDFLGVY
jgi:hypothetical protein